MTPKLNHRNPSGPQNDPKNYINRNRWESERMSSIKHLEIAPRHKILIYIYKGVDLVMKSGYCLSQKFPNSPDWVLLLTWALVSS